VTAYRSASRDRTPPRRAVPALLSLGLLLLIGWLLLAIDRLDRPDPVPAPARPAGPMTVTIPGIGVDAGIVAVGLRADGAMQLPDPAQVGWYRRGPRPGAPGPAVLIGHVDSDDAPAVFYRLRELRPGDEILVSRADGSTIRFVVERLERHPKTALPVERIWAPTSKPLLRLITCGGSFDHTTRHYRENLIVYAARAGA
jgi:sortase (surface protein transpeptidase)